MSIVTTDNKHYNDIANAIREKTGTETTYTPEEMITGVAEVYDAGVENALSPIRERLINRGEELSESADVEEITGCIDELKLLSDLSSFAYFFYNEARLSIFPNLKYKDTSKAKSFQSMFFNCGSLTTVHLFDTSNGTNFNAMFNYCSSLTTVPLFDTSNGTNFGGMFSKCSKLTTIPQFDTSNGIEFSNMFYNCTSLTTITELNVSKNKKFSNTFYNCTNLQNITFVGTININGLSLSHSTQLTHYSLMSLINALADKSGTTGTTWKVTIGSTN